MPQKPTSYSNSPWRMRDWAHDSKSRASKMLEKQRTGIVESDLTAGISQPYMGFGFVILNKGNLGGVIANALLDVKRGKFRVVARLKVRDVEQAMSVRISCRGPWRKGSPSAPATSSWRPSRATCPYNHRRRGDSWSDRSG